MAEEIISKCSALRLVEEEGDIIDLGAIGNKESDEKLKLLLIGRLVTDRPFNIEAFKRTMKKAWNPLYNMVIKVIGPNLFAFQFFHWKDKEKVINGRPWCFENHLIVIKEVEGDEQPEKINLMHSPFWVRVEKLPFNCRTNDDIKAITASLGDFMEIEEDILGLERFRRVRIMLDIRNPLRRFQWVRIEYKYERLPFFCLACGVIGHSERDCTTVSEEERKKSLGWGLYLRASPRNGYTKNLEEINQITTSRRQLFITKEPGIEVSPVEVEVAKQKIVERRGEEKRVEGETTRAASNVSSPEFYKEPIIDAGNLEEQGNGGELSAINNSDEKLLKQGKESEKESKKLTKDKRWKRVERNDGGAKEAGIELLLQKRSFEDTEMEFDKVEGNVGKKLKVSEKSLQVSRKTAEVDYVQPRREP